MSAIGSLMFCDDCGTLLEQNNEELLTCDHCGSKWKDVSARSVITNSKPSDFPSSLRNKMSQVQAVPEGAGKQENTIREPCIKCGHEEIKYTTQQLRSADEGETVFYRCPKCQERWSTNN